LLQEVRSALRSPGSSSRRNGRAVDERAAENHAWNIRQPFDT
jgi:hypothetical protein